MSTADDIIEVAPPDVADAVRWVLSEGALVDKVTPLHGMGFALLVLTLDGLQVRVVSDRDQWSLGLRMPRQPWLQFDAIYAVLANASEGTGETNSPWDLPSQLPIGVSWRKNLPDAVAWLRSTPSAHQRVAEAKKTP